jgi:hypothetical protein
MKLLLLLALLVTLGACQNPSRIQAAQANPLLDANEPLGILRRTT